MRPVVVHVLAYCQQTLVLLARTRQELVRFGQVVIEGCQVVEDGKLPIKNFAPLLVPRELKEALKLMHTAMGAS